MKGGEEPLVLHAVSVAQWLPLSSLRVFIDELFDEPARRAWPLDHAKWLLRTGRADEAEATLRQSVVESEAAAMAARAQQQSGVEPGRTRSRMHVVHATRLHHLACCLRDLDRWSEAEHCFRTSLELYGEAPDATVSLAVRRRRTRFEFARSLIARGRPNEAIAVVADELPREEVSAERLAEELRIVPNLPFLAIRRLVSALVAAGHLDHAGAIARELLDEERDDPFVSRAEDRAFALFLVSGVLGARSAWSEEERVLRDMLETAPSRSLLKRAALVALSANLERVGRWSEGERILRAGIEVGREQGDDVSDLEQVLAERGRAHAIVGRILSAAGLA